ncbi:hypothetical protein COY65_01475 [Candidatus Jorgensenbacteria bacterium CG_4_10_14_0_8_um_filter_39_13]|uniref:AbiEi antitoxin C-terminal domain-containing protein n=2 Tax=Candidatus Joergenseniibacteriota TaxID=1752739 RepID=A0A2M7RHU7_9BACT|nr:MAG: hypothetical protein COV54_00905 [Candidatus Jorgensenbacteria bacterium CG11_big_fil_rev_8_21_14_0_20_38_23]PIV13077.1 MAG: hypothetical protein COS46_02075 [Candidatus Jorgensenbacteria bacterium CG03_land_8_20_14_0_80_38_39]PIW97657.1 MAG: hypothetical protein COZ81_01425 [Candidatus Jorgensenbacteria bacterium CG_4_8_14_3_um_filter_38_10]PIY96137.1 MAG: hypothetical protein COY65_01475 [Candidatus Jorgensenbacteria bacterium CG_4_10_14_0_8_um_filter_39_13]
MSSAIEILLKTQKTVFAIQELSFLWKIRNSNTLKSKIYFLVKNKKLISLKKGIYALNQNYDKFELANKLRPPSYISLETVLRNSGIIFQYSSDIISISNISKTIKCQRINYVYHKIKNEVLFNKMGIKISDKYWIAEPERAFLDIIYLNKNYYFDNLSQINWGKCFSLVEIYKNKALKKRLKDYFKDVEKSKT